LDSLKKEDEAFIIWPKSGSIEVEDGKYPEIICEAILETKGLKDGTILHFIVPKEDHGWWSDSTGTQFARIFDEDTESNDFKLSVDAEKFLLRQTSEIVGLGMPFSFSGALVDRFGNVDLDYDGDEHLAVRRGGVDVGGISLFKDENGLFRWDGIVAKTPGEAELEIQFPGSGIPATRFTFEVVPEIKSLIQEDFEANELSGWRNTASWIVDSEGAISGTYSLRHKSGMEEGESFIFYPFEKFNGDEYQANWEFTLKSGNWNPSSRNHFLFFFGDGEFGQTLFSGYSLGVNQIGSNDSLQFCSWKEGTVEKVLQTFPLLWKESTEATMQVERFSNGIWNVSFNNYEGSDSVNTFLVEDNQFSDFSLSGLLFNFTTTRSGKLWMDDVSLRIIPSPIAVKKIEAIAANNLRITFSKPYELNSALDLLNYRLERKNGEQILLRGIEQENETSILLETGKIDTSYLNLYIQGVEDIQGMVMKQQVIDFRFLPPVLPDAIVFNEIMADPTPSQGLPDFEYIELFNRSNYPVDLKDWKLQFGQKLKILPDVEMVPGGYVLITTSGGVEVLAPYGSVIGIPGLSLNNAGANLALLDTSNTIITELNYKQSWLNDKNKEEGGWSLECIDPDRFCGQSLNWQASKGNKGGTPGIINSIMAENKDFIEPQLRDVRIISPGEIELVFSEAIQLIDTLPLLTPFVLIDSIINKQEEGIIILTLENQLQSDVKYEIKIPGFKDDCGNFGSEVVREIQYHSIKPGEVFINEILFNPKAGGSDYVELHNPYMVEINAGQLFLANRNENLALDEVVSISSSKIIREGEFIVLTTDSANIRTLYPNVCEDCFVEIENMPSYPDKEGYVVLLNDSMEIVDEVAYSEKHHFALLEEKEGVALERVSCSQKSDDPSNWQSAATISGFGTPGLINSQVKETVNRAGQFYFEPNPFSPNNDGFNDRLTIHMDFKDNDVCSVRIFDSRGRAIRFLANNLYLGNPSKLIWDGLDDEGNKVPMGTYIVLAEFYDMNGNRKIFRQTVGVTDRLD